MELISLISSDLLALFLLTVVIGSVLVMLLSQPKARVLAFLLACGAGFAFCFLYVADFRQFIMRQLNLPINSDKLALAISEGGSNVLTGTSPMLMLEVVILALGLVVVATRSRKLGIFIAGAAIFLMIATAMGFLQPIISALAS